jgi:acyl dehydratase
MATYVPKEELLAMTGREAGPSEWLRVDQDRIDIFADATEDHQFIHVDTEQAARTPLGATIAHGYLTLSLLPRLNDELMVMPEGTLMTFNYGLDRVRFLQPVKSGSRLRLRSKILEVKRLNESRILLKSEARVEIEGEAKPAVIAETLYLFMLGEGE